jgi:hypothetical protein
MADLLPPAPEAPRRPRQSRALGDHGCHGVSIGARLMEMDVYMVLQPSLGFYRQ